MFVLCLMAVKDIYQLTYIVNSMKEIFSRTTMLIGEDKLELLNQSKVIIFGVGGVGGYVFEALARSGIGQIDIVDNDVISLSNINRQIIATIDNVGKYKVDVLKERGLNINPNVIINKYKTFVLDTNIDDFDLSKYDYVVDALDTINAKIAIIEKCYKNNIKVISSMGTGNKLNPLDLKVSDIYKTKVCPLARVMRYELKKRDIKKLKVVYSEEEPIKNNSSLQEVKENGRPVPSSIAFVPSACGLVIASEIIKDLIK